MLNTLPNKTCPSKDRKRKERKKKKGRVHCAFSSKSFREWGLGPGSAEVGLDMTSKYESVDSQFITDWTAV